MMPAKVSTKRPSFVLSVTAESNDSSPVPSSPPSTGKLFSIVVVSFLLLKKNFHFYFASPFHAQEVNRSKDSVKMIQMNK